MQFGFPILIGGGIGDCFLTIGRFPISMLGRCGIPCILIYTTPGHPAELPIRQFCEALFRCRFIVREPKPIEKWLNQKWLAFSGRFIWIFPPPIPGFKTAKNDPNTPGRLLKVGLHTHLDGHHHATNFWAKIWNSDNWRQFIITIKANHRCELFLLEWNVESAQELLKDHPEMINLAYLDLLTLCQRIAAMDVLVSVDSWTKYVAGWA